MIYIGFGHRSRVGKDTAANIAKEHIRNNFPDIKVKKYSLAWELKQQCYNLYKWSGLKPPEYYDTEEGQTHRTIKLRDLGLTPVELWIEYGNKIRDIFPDTWVYKLKESAGLYDVCIVPDIRFLNEIYAFTPFVYKVENSRVPWTTSVSDKMLINYGNWRATLHNEGSIEDFKVVVQRLITEDIFPLLRMQAA